MIKKHSALSILLFFFAASFATAQSREPVAVLDFVGIGVSQSDASAISSLFTAELVQSSQFEVMDRKNINEILTEHKLQLSGCTDTSCAVEIGQILSLQYIFSGEVSKLGDSFIATINYIDVETSKIERSTTQKFGRIDDVYDILPAAVAELTGNADYAQRAYSTKNETIWWDTMSKSQKAGFITMLSGTAVAATGGILLALTGNYYEEEVAPLYETYTNTGGGFEEYESKAKIKNALLISSVSGLGAGLAAAGIGTYLWLKMPDEEKQESTARLSFNLLPLPGGAISLQFNINNWGRSK